MKEPIIRSLHQFCKNPYWTDDCFYVFCAQVRVGYLRYCFFTKGTNRCRPLSFHVSKTSGLIISSLDLAETRVLIMEDMLVFLQEKDQKYSLLSLDQKVRSRFVLCAIFFLVILGKIHYLTKELRI